MYKILIRHKGQVYKFLNYEFQDERDGSLYIVFDRLGKGPGMNWGSRTEIFQLPTRKRTKTLKFLITRVATYVFTTSEAALSRFTVIQYTRLRKNSR